MQRAQYLAPPLHLAIQRSVQPKIEVFQHNQMERAGLLRN